MKKIIRTFVTMILAVSVIMPGAQAFAQENTNTEFTSVSYTHLTLPTN